MNRYSHENYWCDVDQGITKVIYEFYTFDCALKCLNDMLADIKRKKLALKDVHWK
jgi:hypothetical protein